MTSLGNTSRFDLLHPRVHRFLLSENAPDHARTDHRIYRKQLHQRHTHLHLTQRTHRTPRSIPVH